MNNTEMKIRFPKVGSGAELEIVAPASSDTETRILDALDRLPVRRGDPYLVHTGARLIASVSLTEHNGGRLSPGRAGEVLDTLRAGLTPGAHVRAIAVREPASELTCWNGRVSCSRVDLSAWNDRLEGGSLPAVA